MRTRLAPSPTGAQHLGNARTHLLTYWAARKLGAQLVFRIDDLDSPRVKPWAIEQAVEDLRWLGIEWDSGPILQSSHSDRYQSALADLTGSPDNLAYPCYCSRKEIAESLSAPHESRFPGEPDRYPGTCSDFRVGDPIKDGDHCWRLRAADESLRFDDLVLGEETCNPARDLGDFPIRTKTGQATYQLAVVVDDMAQEVDLVIRGRDLVASTFRQLQLYSLLGRTPPSYAHVPLVLGLDGRRLAKRHGDTRLSFYRERGIRPEQIIGWAAHSAGLVDNSRPCKASEVIDNFQWSLLSKDDVHVDPNSLFD